MIQIIWGDPVQDLSANEQTNNTDKEIDQYFYCISDELIGDHD
jgi:hypothetical protein